VATKKNFQRKTTVDLFSIHLFGFCHHANLFFSAVSVVALPTIGVVASEYLQHLLLTHPIGANAVFSFGNICSWRS
jgi:hypothetical protein